MPAQLQAAREGQTLVLTLSNPELRNAIDPAMYAAGIEALNVAESSAEVRSVVITGAAGVFCSGGNLLRLQASRQADPQVQAQSIEGLHSWIETIRTFPKPVIAAVEGAAAGAGFSLALACDLVVAARNAVFGHARHGAPRGLPVPDPQGHEDHRERHRPDRTGVHQYRLQVPRLPRCRDPRDHMADQGRNRQPVDDATRPTQAGQPAQPQTAGRSDDGENSHRDGGGGGEHPCGAAPRQR